MTIHELLQHLEQASSRAGPDSEVMLCYEQGAMEEGYDPKNTEGINDIRLIDDWPLPGKSLINPEHEKKQTVVIFYDNHYKLDSSLSFE